MSFTWSPGHAPAFPPIGPGGWLLIVLRLVPLAVILVLGVALAALLRLVELPLFGGRRPVTPFVTVAVCRLCLAVIGLRLLSEGKRMQGPGAIVANHASWLDILVLNARKRVYFVAKAEVSAWPGIGLLARITGTVFITRARGQAKTQVDIFAERLRAGHKLLFFPEGTSTDGLRVLPFKTALFQAFLDEETAIGAMIQPVTLVYTAPGGCAAHFYGWWGDMGLAEHLWQVLSAPRQGKVKIVYHPPVTPSEFDNRKLLAQTLERAVRGGMPGARQSRV